MGRTPAPWCLIPWTAPSSSSTYERLVRPGGPEDVATCWRPRRQGFCPTRTATVVMSPDGTRMVVPGPGLRVRLLDVDKQDVHRHGLEDPVGLEPHVRPRRQPVRPRPGRADPALGRPHRGVPGQPAPAEPDRRPSRSSTGPTAPAWSSPPPTAGPGPRTRARTSGSTARVRPPHGTSPSRSGSSSSRNSRTSPPAPSGRPGPDPRKHVPGSTLMTRAPAARNGRSTGWVVEATSNTCPTARGNSAPRRPDHRGNGRSDPVPRDRAWVSGRGRRALRHPVGTPHRRRPQLARHHARGGTTCGDFAGRRGGPKPIAASGSACGDHFSETDDVAPGSPHRVRRILAVVATRLLADRWSGVVPA